VVTTITFTIKAITKAVIISITTTITIIITKVTDLIATITIEILDSLITTSPIILLQDSILTEKTIDLAVMEKEVMKQR
jgi:hypothetical protein